MTYSEIKITFLQEMPIHGRVLFEVQDSSSTLRSRVYEIWTLYRTGSNQVGSGISTNSGTFTGRLSEQSAINFLAAFNLDYNNTGIYVTQRIANKVIIKSTNPNIVFDNESATLPADIGGIAERALNVEFSINNFDSNTLFRITDISFSQATNPCTHYRVNITTSELATQYTINNGTPITENIRLPLSFEIPRGQGFLFSCQNENGQTANQGITSFEAPKSFNSAVINLQITGSPFGATLVVTSTGILQYSLNGTDYQSNNTFTGLHNGDYIIYVKDKFGCLKTKAFNINTNNVVEPEFSISKSMSFRFSRVIEYGNCRPYPTDEDSMSCKEFSKDKSLAYGEIQKFQTCDSIVTQFKSNFSNISVKVAKPNGSTDNLVINQMTNYIGRKDARNAWRYNIEGGYTGIYFTVGNIYDYDTGVDTGETFALNGDLPEWGRIGEYISIGSAWHKIENIVFDESINAEVLVIHSNTAEATASPIIVKCQFNRQKYEVYEFVTQMALYEGMDIQVQIFNKDPHFESIVVVSELINVKEKQKDTVEIVYWNNTNTDVFYKTGIKNKIRLPIVDIIGDHTGNSEALASDTKSSLIEARVYELDEFIFEPMSKGMYRKIVQALMHKFVIINGVGYHIDDKPEKEGPLGNSNQYQVKAKMIKTSVPYTANIIGVEPEIITADNVLEVPNLTITDNGDFISYD